MTGLDERHRLYGTAGRFQLHETVLVAIGDDPIDRQTDWEPHVVMGIRRNHLCFKELGWRAAGRCRKMPNDA